MAQVVAVQVFSSSDPVFKTENTVKTANLE